MKKTTLSNFHIERLIVLANHLQQCRFNDYKEIMEYYCPERKAPYLVYQGNIYFQAYPFIYTELPKLYKE